MRFKNLKKVVCAGLAATMIFTAPTAGLAAGSDSTNEKLAQIELDTYGSERTGAILSRLGQLEKAYSGQNMRGNMNARIDAIYNIIYNNDAAPGFLAKMNALEWNIRHEVGGKSVAGRLGELESETFGEVKQGTFNERIKNLSRETFGSEEIPMAEMQIPGDKIIKVELAEDVNSRELQVGDTISIKVAKNVIIDGNLVLAKGLPGEGTVTEIKNPKAFGRNAKMTVDFHTIRGIDGREIPTYTGEESKKEMKRLRMAGGASLVGIIIMGPLGAVAGVFVKGKNVDLPAGTEVLIQTKGASNVYALQSSEMLQIEEEDDEEEIGKNLAHGKPVAEGEDGVNYLDDEEPEEETESEDEE